MAAVTAFAAKTRFGELLERVAAGEEIVITRHDKPVARIVREGAPRLADPRVRASFSTASSAHRLPCTSAVTATADARTRLLVIRCLPTSVY